MAALHAFDQLEEYTSLRRCTPRTAPTVHASPGSSGPTLADITEAGAPDVFVKTPMALRAAAQQLHACTRVQHWMAAAVARCPRHIAPQYHGRIAHALLCFSAEGSSGGVQPGSDLNRRGAKSYLAFLVQNGLSPQSANEWAQLRAALTSPTPGGHATTSLRVAALPLLPSGVRVADESLRSLSATATWRELHAIIHWHTMYVCQRTTAVHISSRDALEVLRRFVLEEGQREGSAGTDFLCDEAAAGVEGQDTQLLASHPLAHLAASSPLPPAVLDVFTQWQRSCAAERADASLAAAAGVDRTCMETASPEVNNDARVGFRTLRHARDYHGALLAGNWRAVVQAAVHTVLPGSRVDGAVSSTSEAETVVADTAVDFDSPDIWARLRRGFGHPATTTVVPLFAHPRVSLRLRLPAAIAASTVTHSEEQLLLCPPTPHLDVRWKRRTSPLLAGSDGSTGELEALRAALRAERTQRGHGSAIPPSVLELRRRLWCLAQLPPHLPRSLVHFRGGGGPMHRTMRAPCVARAPAKEVLAWLLVAATQAAMDGAAAASAVPQLSSSSMSHPAGKDCANGVDGTTSKGFLQAVRAAVLPVLFVPHCNYEAFHEHLLTSLLLLGTVPATGHWSAHVERVGRTAVATLLQPLDPPALLALLSDAGGGSCYLTGSPEVLSGAACATLWRSGMVGSNCQGGGDDVTPLARTTMSHAATTTPSAVHCTPCTRRLVSFLSQRLLCLRNYHVSLYWEALTQTATLTELLEAIRTEVQLYGPPVLAPETAAALLTCLTLRLLPVASQSLSEQGHGAGSSHCPHLPPGEVSALLRDAFGDVLYFAVPAHKMHAVGSYLKGINPDEGLATPLQLDPRGGDSAEVVSCEWGSAAALLTGRSLRRLGPYPSTTTDHYLRVEATPSRVLCESSRPPSLQLRLLQVRVSAVLEEVAATQLHHWRHADLTTEGGGAPRGTGDSPCVVALGLLPHGLHAVYKPAGVNTTLHAKYPSLIPFLQTALPWQSEPPGGRTVAPTSMVPTALPQPWWAVPSINEAPVNHQHGLINRVDVGTSGLVLAASDPAALHAGKRAGIVQHRIHKSYVALVQYVGASGGGGAGPLLYLPPRGSVNAEVLASGADTARLQALANSRRNAACVASAVGSSSDHSHLISSQGRPPLTLHSKAPPCMQDRRGALTRFRVLEYFPSHEVYYIRVELTSGRRHQIRQHMSLLQFPLVGDARYHTNPTGMLGQCPPLDRPALHAVEVRVVGETAGTTTVVQCDLPADMIRLLTSLRRANDDAERGL